MYKHKISFIINFESFTVDFIYQLLGLSVQKDIYIGIIVIRQQNYVEIFWIIFMIILWDDSSLAHKFFEFICNKFISRIST